MTIKYIDNFDIKGKNLLIRVDVNVPLDELGNITDDTRIRGILPTINYALDEGAKVILASHMGRPKGKVNKKLSMEPVAKRLRRLLKKEVVMPSDCIGPDAQKVISNMDADYIVLLENLRFHAGEEKNDDDFAKELAQLADIYINDAFAVSHRAHASLVAVTKFFDMCGAGFLMKKELDYFDRAMENPARPLVAILGGAKVSTKLGALENLVKKVDKVIVGGGMAFTFLKTLGYEVGKSLAEDKLLDTAQRVLELAKERNVKFYLPVDCVVADKFDSKAQTRITPIQEIPRDWMALDIGPATTKLFAEVLQDAKTIIWNGPMGAFEIDAFSRGTFAMVTTVANSYDALTIIGGGDTDVVVNKAGELHSMSYISTGGGAFISLLEGTPLPGIEVLRNKH
ncbi:MAG: phosphoglycerate kinase [Thermodesulfobacteriota bacterium]|nr:phosphoglycerate kinase [Thermodesulfobacteriota bacterium]